MNQKTRRPSLTSKLKTGVRNRGQACCLTLGPDKISSPGICIHQPQRSIPRHAEDYGTSIIENRNGLTYFWIILILGFRCASTPGLYAGGRSAD
jgi:hypothetical protein